MKHLKRKQALLFGGISCIGFVAIGLVFAYSHDASILNNLFRPATYSYTVTENFVSPDNWSPGEEIPKTISIQNNSNVTISTRLSYTEYWVSKTGVRLAASRNGVRLAELKFQNEGDWDFHDGYYYYANDLAPGEEAESPFESVTLSRDADLGGTNRCVAIATGTVCTKPDNLYDGAKYHLVITIESIQTDAAESEWFDVAYLKTGEDINVAIKQLVGITNPDCDTDDRITKSIVFTNELPEGIDPETSNKALLSLDGSTPVYAYDDGEHNIYIYSTAKKIFANDDSSKMFCNMYALRSLVLTELFDTSNVTNMNAMFKNIGVSSLTLPESFNTSRVKDMSIMFATQSLASIIFPSTFDTSRVEYMYSMFWGTFGLREFVLPDTFDTSSVKNMYSMFYDTSATSITLPAAFDTSSVTNMKWMFGKDTFLRSLSLPEAFDTSSVTTMEGMFMEIRHATSFTLPPSFKINTGTNITGIFNGSAFSSTTLNSTADDSVKTIWPGIIRND